MYKLQPKYVTSKLPHIYCILINSVTLSYLSFCILELNVYSPLFILIIVLLMAEAR